MRGGMVKNYLIDLLYPRRCPVCQNAAPYGEEICPECRKRLPYIRGPVCLRCGRPVREGEALCADCAEIRHDFDAAVSGFLYDDVMREAVAALKYKGRKEYGRVLGRLLYACTEKKLRRFRAEAVVPVPVHAKKKRERGYNQAELIAREVAEGLKKPLLADALIRTKYTKAMKTLSAKARRTNLRNAFEIGPGFVPVRSALIVDDIYTTGSTADACAAVLKEAGVKEVFAVTLAVGISTSDL